MTLHPCPSCARHVREGSERCPFCKGPMPAWSAPAPVRRVARMAFAVATTTAALSCGKDHVTDPKPPPEPTNVPVALYGAPPEMVDAGAIVPPAAPSDAAPPKKK